MALATTVMMAWGLARPALWLDEGATMMATQRTWSDVWTLWQGPEAPLVPYYLLLKAFCDAAGQAAPILTSDPELLFRLPSAIMAVFAGWALIAWLNRFCPPRLVFATAVLLLLAGSFSRYGQEARPYAAVLLAAVVSTIIWSVLITDPRRRWPVAYVFSVVALIALHTLSAGLIMAHLVAAVLCTGPGGRPTAVLDTMAAAISGLLLVSPLVLISVWNGTGPQYVYPDVTWDSASTVFVRLFTLNEHPILAAGPVVLLAAIGLTRVTSSEYWFIARLAACWALVPPAVLGAILLVQPNLLFERYLLFVVPAWAILAGLGVVTVAELGQGVVARLPGSRPALETSVVGGVILALLGGTVVQEASTQRQIRTLGGHGEDIRPALAISARPEYAGLPIVVSSRFGSVLVDIYAPAQDGRLVTQRIQRTETTIWPAAKPSAEYKPFLKQQHQVILLQRSNVTVGCEQLRPVWPADQLEQCMPAVLKTLHYRVERIEPAGTGWGFAVLQREA